MKQMLALTLACALCFVLVACNSEPAKPIDDASMANETATEAVADKQYDESKLLESVYGNWQDINDGTLYLFREDGSASMQLYKIHDTAAYMDTQSGSCSLSEDFLKVEIGDRVFTLMPKNEENIIHLVDTENGVDCVPQEEFDQFVDKISIDTENFEEYFELRTSQHVVRDAEGNICGGTSCDGYFLKDEYYSRLMPACKGYESEVEVSANVQTENEWIKEDTQSGAIEFTPGYNYGDNEPSVCTMRADQLMTATMSKTEDAEFLMNDPNNAFAAISLEAYGVSYAGGDWVGPEGALSMRTTITELLSASGTIYLRIEA